MKILLSLLLTFSFYFVMGQRIELERSRGGIRFYSDTLDLSSRQVLDALRDFPDAVASFKKFRSNAGLASVLGFTGGLFIGLPIGTAIAGGQPEWALAGVGVALIGVGIPLNKKSRQHAEEALTIYNREISMEGHLHLRMHTARLTFYF